MNEEKETNVIKSSIEDTKENSSGNSNYQPNWTWERHGDGYTPPRNQFKLPSKSWSERFWEFLGIGFFAFLCNLLVKGCF